MRSHRLTAAALIWAVSLTAGAAEIHGARPGTAETLPDTTATLHCGRMSGPQREACMRDARGARARSDNPSAPASSPGDERAPVGATGPGTAAPGEIGTSRSDIGNAATESRGRR